jgi:transcriptional regulator with XRE-family HTH domain
MTKVKTPGNKGKPTRKRVTSAFAANLKQILKERGINLKTAAQLAGVTPAVVHAWENGGQPHDLNAVVKLSQALKCDFQWLVTGTTSKVDLKDMTLTELFDVQDDPAFSGLFLLEAKRLKRRT